MTLNVRKKMDNFSTKSNFRFRYLVSNKNSGQPNRPLLIFHQTESRITSQDRQTSTSGKDCFKLYGADYVIAITVYIHILKEVVNYVNFIFSDKDL